MVSQTYLKHEHEHGMAVYCEHKSVQQLYIWYRINFRVSHYFQFSDVILYNLTKDVDGQYKMNTKKLDFYLMKCPGAAIFTHFRHLKMPKNTEIPFFSKKIINGFKIIIKVKEKRFWKAFCPNKLIFFNSLSFYP